MKLILCQGDHISSKLLALFMWSRWSHSAIYDDQTGLVYDTTFFGGGCKVTPYDQWARHYSTIEVRDIKLERPYNEAVQWLEEQVGKPYDWTAVLGIGLHRDWQEDDRWFCSEHTESFISLFSTARFRTVFTPRITPQHQAMHV